MAQAEVAHQHAEGERVGGRVDGEERRAERRIIEGIGYRACMGAEGDREELVDGRNVRDRADDLERDRHRLAVDQRAGALREASIDQDLAQRAKFIDRIVEGLAGGDDRQESRLAVVIDIQPKGLQRFQELIAVANMRDRVSAELKLALSRGTTQIRLEPIFEFTVRRGLGDSVKRAADGRRRHPSRIVIRWEVHIAPAT